MPWCVEQCNHPPVALRLVGANVLRNATGFARSSLVTQNRIQQARLAMINMPHHRHNRWARHRPFRQCMFHAGAANSRFLFLKRYLKAQLFNDDRRRLKVQSLINRRRDTILIQLANERRDR